MPKFKPSQIVVALADLASRGRYDGVTPEAARKMNALFVEVAELINQLESQERAEAEGKESNVVSIEGEDVSE